MATGVNVGVAHIDVVGDFSKFGSQAKSEVAKTTSTLGSQLKSAGALLGVTLGAAFVVGFAKSSIAAFEEAEKANRLLEKSFEALGETGSQMLQPIIDWASELQFEIGMNDEAIKGLIVRLVQMGRSFFQAVGPESEQLIENLTLGLINMAQATGKSVNMLMRSLGPSILNEPERALVMLEKYNVVTDEQAESFRKMVAAGDEVGASIAIINLLTERYSGVAASATTDSEKLANAVDEIQEAFGAMLVPIVRVLAGIARWISQNTELAKTIGLVTIALVLWFKVLKGSVLVNFIQAIFQLGVGFVQLAAQQGIATAATTAFTLATGALRVALIATLTALGPIGVAFLAIGSAIAIANKTGHEFEDWAKTVIDPVVRVSKALLLVKNDGVSMAAALKIVDKETDHLRVHLNKAGHASRNFANLTTEALKDFKSGVVDSVQVAIGQFKSVKEAFKVTGQQLANQARAAVRIAKTEHNDLKKIFADKSLTEGQKRALASLPADMRHAFVEAGAKQREQIAEDALKLQKLNDQNFNELTTKTKKVAGDGGEDIGEELTLGAIRGIVVKSPELNTAVMNAVRSAIAAGVNAAGGNSTDWTDSGGGPDPGDGPHPPRPTPRTVTGLSRGERGPIAFRIVDWRNGIGELDNEMAWTDPRR